MGICQEEEISYIRKRIIFAGDHPHSRSMIIEEEKGAGGIGRS